MGADFLCYVIGMPIGEEPRWHVSEKEMKEAAKRYKKSRDDDSPVTDVAEDLRHRIRELRDAWGGGYCREAAVFQRGHEKILVTGGMSWGDDPTDLSSTIQDLYDAELIDILGFDDFDLDDNLFDNLNLLLKKVRARGMTKEAEAIRNIFHQIGAKVLFR